MDDSSPRAASSLAKIEEENKDEDKSNPFFNDVDQVRGIIIS